MTEAQILLKGVGKRFANGVAALHDVSLQVQPGEVVVVVGYGVQRKSDVTGNISTVKGAAIADNPVQSFDPALGDKAAGVQITSANGVVSNPPVFQGDQGFKT